MLRLQGWASFHLSLTSKMTLCFRFRYEGRGECPDASQIDLSGAQHWQSIGLEEMIRLWFPECRQIASHELLDYRGKSVRRERREDDKPFAFLFIGQSGDGEDLFGHIGQLLQLFLNADVGHH